MTAVRRHDEADAERWNRYVRSHPSASIYHLWEWRDIVGGGLGRSALYLGATRNGQLCGVLPLVCLAPWRWRPALFSMPYASYGGILADDPEASRALLCEAIEQARARGVSRLELRHRVADVAGLPARTHRVSMVLELPEDRDVLWGSIRGKLRNQVRKADRSGLKTVSGGIELLSEFHDVFAQNMRDLGSPVWSRGFFARILETFPQRARICVVRLGTLPLAAGFVLRFKHGVEIPWASSRRDYNHLCANVRMYWEVLSDATDIGYRWFDFGRSAPDGSHFRFKRQWGAKPRPLYWHYWPSDLLEGSVLEDGRDGLERMWRQLPVWVTLLAGPPIRRWLPQ